jgi:hypothetical protein
MVDRLALRVEHAGFQGDENARFHGLAFSGVAIGGPMPRGRPMGKLYPIFTLL